MIDYGQNSLNNARLIRRQERQSIYQMCSEYKTLPYLDHDESRGGRLASKRCR